MAENWMYLSDLHRVMEDLCDGRVPMRELRRRSQLQPFLDENCIEVQASAEAQLVEVSHHLYRHDGRLWKELAAASGGA